MLESFLTRETKQVKHIFLFNCTSLNEGGECLHKLQKPCDQSTSSCDLYITEKWKVENREHKEFFTVIRSQTVER